MSRSWPQRTLALLGALLQLPLLLYYVLIVHRYGSAVFIDPNGHPDITALNLTALELTLACVALALTAAIVRGRWVRAALLAASFACFAVSLTAWLGTSIRDARDYDFTLNVPSVLLGNLGIGEFSTSYLPVLIQGSLLLSDLGALAILVALVVTVVRRESLPQDVGQPALPDDASPPQPAAAVSVAPLSAPPGWYPQPDGSHLYWDGTQWLAPRPPS